MVSFLWGYILHSGSIGERGNSIFSFYRTLVVLHNSGINLYPSLILMCEEVAHCGGLNFLIISDIELFFHVLLAKYKSHLDKC